MHDIQDFPGSSADEADGTSTLEDDNAPDVDETKNNIVIDSGDSSLDASSSELSGDSSTNMYSRPVVHIRFNCTRRTPSGGSDEEDNDNDNNSSNNVAANQERRAVDVTFRLPMTSFEALEAVAATIASRQRNYNNNTNQGSSSQSNPLLTPRNDENGAESDVSQLSASRERTHNLDLDDSSLDPYSSSDHEDDAVHVDLRERATYFMRTGSQLAARTLLLLGSHRRNLDNNKESKSRLQKTPRSRPRLSHFIAEPNVGRGFIKELCFSTDGRLVCSPFGHGVRLLAFNPTCSELCDSVPDTPTKLYEIATNVCHPYVVVSTKFSPTHCLLVSGCLRGQICFHRPVIE